MLQGSAVEVMVWIPKISELFFRMQHHSSTAAGKNAICLVRNTTFTRRSSYSCLRHMGASQPENNVDFFWRTLLGRSLGYLTFSLLGLIRDPIY